MYAQTNIQLFNQLRRGGYAGSELSLLCDAYALAAHLYSGYFIGSGRTQIAHVIGTASILGALHCPIEMVAAGLIHNVYDNGDFGDGRRGAHDARRRQIRQVVGAKIEDYVYRFPVVVSVVLPVVASVSSPQTIANARKKLVTLDPVDRQVLLISLAEKLDHALSHEYINCDPLRMKEMAEQIKLFTLATELERAFSSPVPHFSDKRLRRSGVLIPRSYRKRLRIKLRPKLSRSLSRARSVLDRGKRLLHIPER